MRHFEELVKVADRVKMAEGLAQPGTPDYDMIIKATLYQAWPIIRAFIEANRTEQGFPPSPRPTKYRLDGSADWQS